MSSLRHLNLAVIAEALDDLRNGQLRRCEAMGFSAADLEALKHPNLVSVLINAQVSWCSVRVNSAGAATPAVSGRAHRQGNPHH